MSYKSIENFARKWMQKFLLSITTMTVNESQGHSNWYQAVQFGGVTRPKFERNRSVNVWMKATVKPFVMKSPEKKIPLNTDWMR